MGYQVVQVITEVTSASKTAKEHREAFTHLPDLARAGQIRKVLVTEVCRLGRRTADILQIIKELSNLRVSIYAHSFGQETLTKEGKRNPTINLVYTLLAEIARMESELLSERIRSG